MLNLASHVFSSELELVRSAVHRGQECSLVASDLALDLGLRGLVFVEHMFGDVAGAFGVATPRLRRYPLWEPIDRDTCLSCICFMVPILVSEM